MKTNFDLLIKNATSLSPLEEAESTLQAIREDGIEALVTSNAGETQVVSVGESEDASSVTTENTNSTAALSVPDVWTPFANERYAEPAEKPVEKPLGNTLQTKIKTLARKLPEPIQKFFGVAPEPQAVEKVPETSLGRLYRWFTGKNPRNRQTAETMVPRKKRTVKRMIWDGFFQLFLIFLRWMVKRTVRNIKENL